MTTMRSFTTGAFILCLLSTPTLAQQDVCDELQKLVKGQYAEYRVDGFGGQQFDLRYAIVDVEQVGGEDHYWLELRIGLPMGQTIMQLLVPGFPFDAKSVSRVVMKMAEGVPAIEYSGEMARSFLQQESLSAPVSGACDNSAGSSDETLATAGGSFEAQRSIAVVGGGEKTVWLAASVPFGLVKFADTGGKGLEITGHGSDAVSSITEEPMRWGVPPN